MRPYTDRFFQYANSGSIISAQELLPRLYEAFPIGSALDIGCSLGAWLSMWRELGVEDVIGVGGYYVPRDKLFIPQEGFIATDLISGFDID